MENEWRIRQAKQIQQAALHQTMARQQALGQQAMGSLAMVYGYKVQNKAHAVYGSPRGLSDANAQRPVVKFKKRYRFHSYYSKVKEQIENTKRSVI